MPGGPRISDDAVARNRASSAARYRANKTHEKKVRQARRDNRFESRAFLGWDGEGYTNPPIITRRDDGAFVVENTKHHYMLFGASTGDHITGESLGTTECLDLILQVREAHPNTYNVGFAFEYDVNMILKDLPWRTLAALKAQGGCLWVVKGRRYIIEHMPHKWFKVSSEGLTATIFDVFGFFHSSYIAALGKYSVGDTEKRKRISDGKAARSNFTYADIESVKEYWQDEISLLPPLMHCIRTACYRGGYRISEWYGPGALAAYLLRDQSVNTWHSKKSTPAEVKGATRYAYAGGEFLPKLCGLYLGPVYTADINSAYIFACSLLPRMDKGKWSRQNPRSIDPANLARFGLYRIQFDAGREGKTNAARTLLPEPPYPLFHRDTTGVLRWPRRTHGWYWTPEAQLVASSPDARILEAWIWNGDGTFPFRFVNDAFNRRLELQRQEDPAEKAYKWGLAAMYGAFARRVGWDQKARKAPPSHELAWAGFITSWCRSAVYDPAMDVYLRGKGKGLISIDTDGVTSTVPFDPATLVNGVGPNLGQWKLEEFTGILQWQNGIYWLRDQEGNWKEPKSRGVPKGAIPFETALEALQGMDYASRPFVHPTLRINRTRFIGFHQALQGQFSKWRQWVTDPVDIAMGGNVLGKAFHFPGYCRACRMAIDGNPPPPESLDSLHTITNTAPSTEVSQPHRLPWLEDIPGLHERFTQEDLIPIVKDGDM